ncbi:hypothetical protein VTO42DRAFT_7128 [Malbranchea cinnamomea]
MSLLKQSAPKNTRRTSPLTSTRHADIKISHPLPYPLPSDNSNMDDTRAHETLIPSPMSSGQIQQLHTSRRPPSDFASHSSAYSNIVSRNPHTPNDSVSSTASKGYGMHRRRASTLRSAMRKLFGRKRQSQGDELAEDERENEPQLRLQSTSISDPDSFFLPMHGVAEVSASSGRSLSLPPQEPYRPGGSANSVRKDLKEDSGTARMDDLNWHPSQERRGHHRRATLPSIVLSTEEARELACEVSQQTATQENISHASSEQLAGIDGISEHRKRRSRSAEELRKIASLHLMSPIQWRRPSQAISYSQYSQANVDSLQSKSRPETRSTVATTAEETDGALPLDNGDFGSPLDFGTLIGTVQDNNEASLAHRVATLEVKLMDLEFAIAKLQGHDISPFQPTRAGDESQEQQPSEAAPQTHQAPPLQDPSFLLSSLRSTPLVTPPRSSPSGDSRPVSIATIRPHTSSQHPSSPQNIFMSHSNTDFSGISVEQYAALTTLVRREQTARKLLETELMQMRKELQQLRNGKQQSGVSSSSRPSSEDLSNDSLTTQRVDVDRNSTLSRNTVVTSPDQTDTRRSSYSLRPRLNSTGQRSYISGMT